MKCIRLPSIAIIGALCFGIGTAAADPAWTQQQVQAASQPRKPSGESVTYTRRWSPAPAPPFHTDNFAGPATEWRPAAAKLLAVSMLGHDAAHRNS
jgi:hypothetical protein